MKKILLLMAIILPFVLTSCGDDKDEPKQSLEQQLIGKWVKRTNNEIFIEFKADHTGIESFSRESMPFTWSLEDNFLFMRYEYVDDGIPIVAVYKFEIAIEYGILYLDISDEGFKRVN